MLASLPMYDRPENAWAHDALWALVRDGLRARGVEAPGALDRAVPHDQGWGRPDLLLGQICNLPWRARFRGRVSILGTADHDEGEAPGLYHSVMVARGEDPGPAPRFALNDPMSNSGWDAPQEWAHENGVAIRPVLVTGSHAASARAVASGAADLAGIDAITWRNLLRWEPAARTLRVVGRTRSTPGMTFIAGPGHDPGPIREALSEALAGLPAEARDLLGLRGMVALPPEAYERPLPPPPVIEPA